MEVGIVVLLIPPVTGNVPGTLWAGTKTLQENEKARNAEIENLQVEQSQPGGRHYRLAVRLEFPGFPTKTSETWPFFYQS